MKRRDLLHLLAAPLAPAIAGSNGLPRHKLILPTTGPFASKRNTLGPHGELRLAGRLSARGKLWVGWNPPASEYRSIRALLFPDLSTKSKIPRVAWVADGQVYGGEVTKLSFENEDEVIGRTLSAMHFQALEQSQEIGFEVPVTLDTEGLFSSVDCDERWYSVRIAGYQFHSTLAASRRVVQRLGCG